MDADPRAFGVLFPLLRGRPRPAAERLAQELERQPSASWPDDRRDDLARRQARAAAALWMLGRPDAAFRMLRHRPDPRARTWLIHLLGPLGADPASLVRRLADEGDVSARRALLLALGEFPDAQLPADLRDPLAARLLDVYRTDPDPGMHSAVRWLLGRWGRVAELAGSDRELAARPPPAGRRWLVNAQGQTLAVVPEPPPFRMGAPRGETGQQVGLEDPHPVRIPRSFALTTTEVTVAQFRVFLHATGAGDHHQHRFAPDLECPMTEVSWFQAARYCRWLSERERIPPDQMCYPPLDQIRPGMKPYPDFLHRTGYRLPTEAEWEYACRAGAATSRFFGSSDELLRRYGWYLFSAHDQTHPVARLKPNDLGLFDIYGNVWEWCHERLDFPPADGQVAVDAERPDDVLREPEGRAVRGGAFASHPWHVRTGYRAGSRPDDRGIASGFRIARTWRPAN